jgi:hypothetical protein
MNDLSQFMKTLKQRFSEWYNAANERKGTLWEERLKSVWLEGSEHVLATMAAYIDLNPVRAEIVQDPKDYRWSGYGQAVAGKREAIEGLKEVAIPEQGRKPSDAEALAEYRKKMFIQGEERNMGRDGYQKGFDRSQVVEVLKNKGKLGPCEMLRCRVRYFTDGAVLGSKAFVNDFFETQRHHFGPRRKSGARKMRGLEIGDMHTLRDLRVNAIS